MSDQNQWQNAAWGAPQEGAPSSGGTSAGQGQGAPSQQAAPQPPYQVAPQPQAQANPYSYAAAQPRPTAAYAAQYQHLAAPCLQRPARGKKSIGVVLFCRKAQHVRPFRSGCRVEVTQRQRRKKTHCPRRFPAGVRRNDDVLRANIFTQLRGHGQPRKYHTAPVHRFSCSFACS